MEPGKQTLVIRNTQPSDFLPIQNLCRRVYPTVAPWSLDQLASHLYHFPAGQLVSERAEDGEIVGMAASLIINWDDYDIEMSYRDFTDRGYFTNHDPEGVTLYGAEVMVDPGARGLGIGKKIYAARRAIAQHFNLKRIRAGARLVGYSDVADQMGPEEYVARILGGHLSDATLNFQLRQGFRVLRVVGDYLMGDPCSQGYAAVIEWLNPMYVDRVLVPEEEEPEPEAV